MTVHEPDTIVLRKKELIQKLSRFGLWNLFVLRLFGQRGSKMLSLRYLSNSMSREDAFKKLKRERSWVNKTEYYIEANTHLFGLARLLPEMPNTKVIFIVRDPRDWTSSGMNKQGWFDKKDFQERLNFGGLKRLTPANVGIDDEGWNNYTPFEKLCWTWNYQNRLFYDVYNRTVNKQCLLWLRFEDIFTYAKGSVLDELYRFITGHDQKAPIELDEMVRSKRINQTKIHRFPKWKEWDPQFVRLLDANCGNLMRELGYGFEEPWLELLQAAQTNK